MCQPQGRVKVVVQTSELRGCRQGRSAARRQHGRVVRRIEPPGHSDLAGRPVLTLQAGSHREGSAASPGPVSTISAGRTDISDFDAALVSTRSHVLNFLLVVLRLLVGARQGAGIRTWLSSCATSIATGTGGVAVNLRRPPASASSLQP